MSELSRFWIERVAVANYDRTEDIFGLVERVLDSGVEPLATAVATCFLENLLNATPSGIEAIDYVWALGPKSREYCKAWDEFTGVATPGL